MTSSAISKISAGVLGLGGISFLFAGDVILPLLAADIPRSATWLSELIGAGWLGLAALNWLSRGSVLGGIYGRPVIIANLALYLVSALVLVRVIVNNDTNRLGWIMAPTALLLAATYGWLLLRGPLRRDTHTNTRA